MVRNLELEGACGKRIVNVMDIYLKDSFQEVNEMGMGGTFFKMETIILANLMMIIMKV